MEKGPLGIFGVEAPVDCYCWLRSYIYVPINSKLQHPPPPMPTPGIWTFFEEINKKLSVQMPHLHMKIMKQ
jgi:hypothetical protein